MITPTHIVTNGWLARKWPDLFKSPTSFVVGGLAPDIGLIAMTVGAAVFYPLVRDLSLAETMRLSFGTLFFESKPWIAAANVLHSPVVVGGLYLVARNVGDSTLSPASKRRLASFAAGCALHIAMDIPVHTDDGPVLFWPLDWNYRFESPVSYWDSNHYGNFVRPVDLAITIVGGAALIRSWLVARR